MTSTVDELALEVIRLRRELDELRAALADEIRTRSIVVDDGERQVEITPGHLTVQGGDGCYVSLSARDSWAELNVTVGDITYPTDTVDTDRNRRRDRQRWVSLLATYFGGEEEADPEASVAVNRVELPVLQVVG